MTGRKAASALGSRAAAALAGDSLKHAYLVTLATWTGVCTFLFRAVYVGGVNAGSAGLFFYDKKCAEARQWRVPEATLCMTALAGGWMGGMYAFRVSGCHARTVCSLATLH